MTWETMASDAFPGTEPPVALMSAASVTSGEPAAGGWAANPVDAPVDDPVHGADVTTSATATAAATAPIPAPMPTLPAVPKLRRRPPTRESLLPRAGAAPGPVTIAAPRVARARSYASGR